ncbi:hypothetical protein SARC_07946 [Sphaeroforma arctica JP610]|uniref:Uncharacterized protein n=1 Tax=Sphaeroforma arctica JP610 TaxID=667725 RepID=A0A0L0FSX3_9EUKA|nr:hypothetical protein SARC_07946 [Sphaeroforma arctica JP610]KNC79666.1 hypothetical protein SARC_07946 [Sphaeroforma arctica JP610]|eukprot:XP_014153568.1 hypothetical protein SARC_07946 [Sphaeroforma arctica JP610]
MSFARSRSLRRNKSWTSRIFWLLVAGGCMYIIDSIFLSNGNQNPSYMREKINGYLPDTLVIDEDNDAMYRDLPPQPKEFMEANGVRRKDHKPLVVLSTGGGLWNTGVWPGWGSEDPTSAKLNWAAAGVVVEKQCEYTCTFTHENSPENLEVADAVVMELVNHPKFLGKQAAKEKPIPWPQSRGRNTPLVYNFFYEPVELYYDYTTHPALQAHVHASIGPLQDTTLPITLLCPWGRGKDAYSHPPPVKRVDRPIAYFNEHGIAAANDRFVKDFINLMGDDQVHRYIHMKNTNLPPEAGVRVHVRGGGIV